MKNKRRALIIVILIIIIVLIGIFKLNQEKNKRKYEIEEISEYKYFLLYENNKMGVIDTNGKVIIEPKYDSIQIPNPSKEVFICLYDYNTQTEEYKTKVLNEKNEEIFTKYEKVTAISLNGIASDIPYEKSVLIYEKDGKYGLIDFEGKVISKANYEEIQGLTYKEGELLVKKDDRYGVINIKGAEIIKPEYNSIIADNFYDEESKYKLAGYIVGKNINSNYNYGYIRYDGKVLLKPEYTALSRIIDIKDTEDIYLIVQNKTKVGLIKNKDTIINFDYKELEYNKDNNILTARKNAKSGILNLQGQEILPIEYDELSINGIYVYTKNEDEEKCFDITGKEIEGKKYKSMTKINNGEFYLIIDENSLYGLLNKENETLIESKYSYLEYLFEDYFIAYNKELGIINSKGENVTEFKYDVLSKIENSNVVQAKDISKNTVELYSKEMKSLGIFKNAVITKRDNYIEVNYEKNTKYFNLDGKELLNTEIYYNNNLFSVEEDGKWGFKNKNGDIIIDCIYDEVTEFNEYGFAGINKDGKWGVIDINKNIILEPTYELKNISTKPFFIDKYYRVYYGYGSVYFTKFENN